jgi:hypothetical protein
VELGDPEPLGVLDDDQRGVGDVDLDDRRRHQQAQAACPAPQEALDMLGDSPIQEALLGTADTASPCSGTKSSRSISPG